MYRAFITCSLAKVSTYVVMYIITDSQSRESKCTSKLQTPSIWTNMFPNPLNGGNVARTIQDRANTNRCYGTADRYTATITGRAKVCGVKKKDVYSNVWSTNTVSYAY